MFNSIGCSFAFSQTYLLLNVKSKWRHFVRPKTLLWFRVWVRVTVKVGGNFGQTYIRASVVDPTIMI